LSRGSPTLPPGAVLGGRFEIASFLGEGSMGEAYEAIDRELGDRVAVKVLRPEISRDEEALQRFKREVQLARRVTHPQVCRVFELFFAAAATARPGEAPGATRAFVTMELLRGETLAQRLERQGQLAPEEALPIAVQMAGALTAAHAAGVVHRDFKSANVMLVPAPSSPAGQRAVITDFGLAYSGGEAQMTATGTLIGSPAYMAPEQVLGREVTPAADVYALGVVLFEMLTGRLPFEADTAIGTALKRLHQPPPALSAYLPQVDERWETAIRGCLALEPEDRFARPSMVADALAGRQVPHPGRAWFRGGRRFSGARAAALVLAVAVGVGVAAGIGAGVWRWGLPHRPRVAAGGGGAPPPTLAAAAPRTAVAVLGFENLARSGEASYVEASLLQMLPTELAAGGRLRLVPSEEVERARHDLGLAGTRSYARDTLARLRDRLDADLVIAGSYLLVGAPGRGGQIRCDLHVQNAATGDTVAELSEVGTEEGFLDLVSRLGADLRARLGAGPLTAADAVAVKAALPANAQAGRLYAEGMEKLNRFEAAAACRLFEQALAADPRNPLLHARLAAAWSALGYEGRARDELRQATAFASNLRFEDRRQIEAQWRETLGDLEGAAAISSELWSYFPDNLEYGLRLARLQAATGHGADAFATLDRLRLLPPPAGADPRVDLAEASVAIAVSSFEKARQAAARAAAKGEAQRAYLVVARSRLFESVALRPLGRLQEALAAAEESNRLAIQAGNLSFAALALNSVGSVLLDRGDVAGAQGTFDQVASLSRRTGDDKTLALALTNLGICHRRQGDLQGAHDSYAAAGALFHRLGDRRREAAVLENLALLQDQDGFLPEARARHQQALAIFRQLGDRSAAATILLNLGTINLAAADLEDARALYAHALATFRQIGEAGAVADAEGGIAEVLAQRGQLDEARRRLAAAVALAERAGEKETAATLRLGLARLELAAGRSAAAEDCARGVGQDPAASASDRRRAAVVRAAALLAAGRRREAAAALDAIAPALAGTGERLLRLEAEIVRGRLLAGGGETAGARRQLAAAAAEARQHGLKMLELEARLAGAEAAPGDPAAQGQLDELEKTASARGLELLRRRADASAAHNSRQPAAPPPSPPVHQPVARNGLTAAHPAACRRPVRFHSAASWRRSS
jgi:tetratricopeptide (TPR) repeat protein